MCIESALFLNSASATEFWTSGIWVAKSVKFHEAAKNKHRKRCAMIGSREDLEETAATVAWLSE